MTEFRSVKTLAVATDDCTRCGHATWETPSKVGHWLCREPMVRRVIQRERIAIGVAREVCDGRFHTLRKAA